jgi:hypothetical protein
VFNPFPVLFGTSCGCSKTRCQPRLSPILTHINVLDARVHISLLLRSAATCSRAP